jgi:hypothetical protein
MKFQMIMSLSSLVLLVSSQGPVMAGHKIPAHLDRTVRSLQLESKQLLRVVKTDMNHSRAYDRLVENAQAMCEDAEHIHEMIHDGGSSTHIMRDLREFETHLNQVRYMADRLQRRNRMYGPRVGYRGHFGHGSRFTISLGSRSSYRTVTRLIESLDDVADALDHCKEDVREYLSPQEQVLQRHSRSNRFRVEVNPLILRSRFSR